MKPEEGASLPAFASPPPSEPETEPSLSETQTADAPAEEEAAELSDWKDALRRDFEQWLDSMDEIPEAEEAPEETPDLYSFHEQLAAANTENRKANRRTAEAISQWGETLAHFNTSLEPLRETVAQLAASQPRAGEMSRAHCLALVEMLDRLERVARAFGSPPGTSWWGLGTAAWRKAWKSQHEAFEIILSHLEGLLKKEGVTRLDVLGQVLDPAVMTAVAAEPDATRPPQTVLEEVGAGYLRRGELLRPAQVKVSRKP